MPLKRRKSAETGSRRAPRYAAPYSPSSTSPVSVGVGVIGWAGAGGFLCLLIFLSINLGRRSSVAEREKAELRVAQQQARSALEAKNNAALEEIETLASQARREEMDTVRSVNDARREAASAGRKASQARGQMAKRVRAALVGVDLAAVFGDGVDLAALDPADLLSALQAYHEAQTTLRDDLVAQAEEAERQAQEAISHQAGPSAEPVDPAGIAFDARARSHKADDPEKGGTIWVVDGDYQMKCIQANRGIAGLRLEYMVIGAHLVRADTFLVYHREARALDLPVGITMQGSTATVYIGRDPTTPSHLDSRYLGYVYILRDGAGNILHRKVSVDWLREADFDALFRLNRGDLFDRNLTQLGAVKVK